MSLINYGGRSDFSRQVSDRDSLLIHLVKVLTYVSSEGGVSIGWLI